MSYERMMVVGGILKAAWTNLASIVTELYELRALPRY